MQIQQKHLVYKNICDRTLESKINQVESADINSKYILRWELIKEITGRISTLKDMINGTN